MKYYFLFLLMAICLCCFSAGAQKISGTINDVQGRPMEGATITLLDAKDSSLQKTIVANENGRFVFKALQKKIYLVTASYAGHIKYISGNIKMDSNNGSVVLPVIVLQPSDKTKLAGIIITTQKKLIEQKLDRTIVNVDAMITAAGSNALEVLAKSPGVMVDINGDISLNGKHGVLVLIDDRPTYMSAQDLSDYLRSLPAGILDKIELMSNPPAKYDASGNAIINIVLKKNRASGFNGNISEGYNQGVYARSNTSLNINYREKKYNLFGNFSYSDNKNFNTSKDSRYFYNPDASLDAVLLINSRYSYQSKAFNTRVGADYFVSPKTTIGIMLTGNVRPKTDRSNYTSYQYDGYLKLDSISTGNTDGKYKWKNYSINLNLQHKFDSTSKKLTADIDYINYNADGSQLFPNYVYLSDSSLKSSYGLQFKTPSNVSIWSVKADYTQPLKGNIRLDAGLKSSYVNNNNQLKWYNQSGTSFIPDYSKSDHFIYGENVNSTYITIVKDWKRWAAEGGLRIENTQANGRQAGNSVVPDSVFSINYTSLFPGFYTSYKLDSSGNNMLTLSYSYRIRRPGYQQLNPFLFYHDRYTYSTGNPGLSPEYGNYIDLRYNYKQYLSITFTYGSQKDIMYGTTHATGDLLITKPQNFPGRHLMGIIPNLSFAPAKWWSINANAVILSFVNKSNGDSIKLPVNTTVHEIEIFNQFHFNKSWSAELTGFFPGRQSFGQYQSGSVYNISAGIQKNILKKQGSLRLKMDDILHTMNPSSKTIGINQATAFHTGKSDTRQIGLSFSYRFGKEANARKRNHNTGGAGDEEKRAN